MKVEAARLVSCAKCGESFELSARNARIHRARGTQPTCAGCRHPRSAPKPPTATERAWWLERFTPDEIREFAEAFWPT